MPTRLLLVVILITSAPAVQAQQPQTVTDLNELSKADPAMWFDAVLALCDRQLREQDLDGVMQTIEATKRTAWHLTYGAPLEEMIDAALPMAQAKGDWKAVGDLCTTRALMTGSCYRPAVARPGGARSARFAAVAGDAYARAGAASEDYRVLVETNTRVEAAKFAEPCDPAELVDTYGPAHAERMAQLFDAVGDARDRDALALLHDVVTRVWDEPDPKVYDALCQAVSALLWLRGAHQVLPELRAAIADRGDPREEARALTDDVARGCAVAWTGKDDAFRDTFLWCLGQRDPRRHLLTATMGDFARKLWDFGRQGEAMDVAWEWCNLARQEPPKRRVESPWGYSLTLWKETPDDLRREVVDLYCEHSVWGAHQGDADKNMTFLIHYIGRNIGNTSPKWAYETAHQLIDASLQYPDATTQARGVAQAAELFEIAERWDLVEQTQRLALGIASQDPVSAVDWAVASAKWAYDQERFSDIVLLLEPIVKRPPIGPCKATVEAALHLGFAHAKLQNTAKATAAVDTALTMLRQAGLPIAEQVGLLMIAAQVAPNPQMQLAILADAEATADEAGLDSVRDAAARQRAYMAAQMGDPVALRDVLLEQVAAQEAKRERLAFDPLLRQEWFADSLGPYRQLLAVAAQLGDVPLALSCAERLRSRALLDQLAWRKVDMGVRLDPATQQRLAALRETRRETYGLLGQSGVMASVGGTRGAYMPFRGGAAGADTSDLGQRTLALQREEAALESVIREAVPAYAMAAQAQIPTPQDVLRTLELDPDLVVLEYTLTESGVALVALRGRHEPGVWLIDATDELLWEHVGKFRELIWERKSSADQEAKWLYAKLVSPAEELLSGAKRVWVAADGILQLAPFAALRGSDGRYLAERMAVACVPSLSVALMSRGKKRGDGLTALVVAAPDTGASELVGEDESRGAYMPIRGMYMPLRGAYMPIRGEGGVDSALTAMASIPLPGAKAEGAAVAEKFEGATLLTDEAATKAALLAQGRTCDVLHIATHGYADPDVPEFSGLLLAGEGDEPYSVLTAQEVYLWDLRARLVTLSACQTAMGKTVQGEGVLGLTRAFIYAGAQNVVCSLWPVSDESTKTLMESFYTNLETAGSVEEALSLAQRALIADEKTSHPFYWAAFVPVRGPQ